MSTKNNSNSQREMSIIERARRAQIVEYAIETIAEVGYAQALLGQIAKRIVYSEVSKGTQRRKRISTNVIES
jgi:AcrR family transcriptional regulator